MLETWSRARKRAQVLRNKRLLRTALGGAIGGAAGVLGAGPVGGIGGKWLGSALGAGVGAAAGDLASKGEHHTGRAAVGGFVGGALPILGAPAVAALGTTALAAGSGALGGYAGEASALPEYERYIPEVG